MERKVIVSIPIHCKADLLKQELQNLGMENVGSYPDDKFDVNSSGIYLVNGPAFPLIGKSAHVSLRVRHSDYPALVKRFSPSDYTSKTQSEWMEFSMASQLIRASAVKITFNPYESPAMALLSYFHNR